MKQWLSEHILSFEDFMPEDTLPLSDKEFYISLSLVGVALILFAVIIHLL